MRLHVFCFVLSSSCFHFEPIKSESLLQIFQEAIGVRYVCSHKGEGMPVSTIMKIKLIKEIIIKNFKKLNFNMNYTKNYGLAYLPLMLILFNNLRL